MNGRTIGIPLKNQDARAFYKIRIILNNERLGESRNYLAHQNAIFRQFIITMCRDLNFP